MKQDELMLGDWVLLHAEGDSFPKPVRVTIGLLSDWVDKLKPIPITHEILVKNGFYYNEKNYVLTYDVAWHESALYLSEMKNIWPDTGYVTGPLNLHSKPPYDIDVFGDLRYVHQLQHLYKFLKIRKDIVL